MESESTSSSIARWVEQARTGDRLAQERLARRGQEAALRLATFSLADPHLAQDVGQEVAIRIVRSLGKLRDPERFDAWTYRICAAEIKRAAGRRKRAAWQPYEEVADAGAEPSFPVVVGERDWLTEALAELNDRQRIAVGLRYVYDLSDGEIARVLRCRHGTVRSLLSRALARLREHAEALEAPEDQPETCGQPGAVARMEVVR